MYAISTAAFVSIITLASSLAGVQAQSGDTSSLSGPRPTCSTNYVTRTGDTCPHLVSLSGVALNTLTSWNPTLDCANIPVGENVCFEMTTPQCTTWAAAPTTTCDALAAAHNLAPKTIYAYNSNVDANCDNLVVGQLYCVGIF